MKGPIIGGFMGSNLYFVFLGVNVLIIICNYNLLKHPKPYPPKEIIKEFKSGTVRLSSSKYIGMSHYVIPRLVKSESNWIDGNAYWYRSGVKLGIVDLVITLITMILGEVFNLYDYLIGLFIIIIPSALGMIYMCYRMEKYILKD
ncbi:hypothetical protein HMPREF9225_1987 [Peptoniphilus duerdenii ATCC BAA-1640]|uniref:Uncharacterized protein n=2 Tax=Peptoniphilus TaxID=162289 RepID=E0NP98_9FIRM|nr:hypothetical protein HMPREF9225_1987 [Peptoniphilus duerdenii ATCC BAA-1640]